MKKIPTLFVRDFSEPSKGRWVTPVVTPGCEWVLEGEGVPTRKYDGTCTMFDGKWWARREVKAGKDQPYGFVPQDYDDTTGKTTGWEPMGQSGFVKFFDEALTNYWAESDHVDPPYGTYELCGPKIQGNPEGYTTHVLVSHQFAQEFFDSPRTYEWLRTWLTDESFDHEGVVWHHPDGRMAKIKRKDFPSA